MASIKTRTRKDGSAAYRLRWNFGGARDGAAQSVTYDHLDDARKMRGAVEARGHLVYASDPAVIDFSLVTGMRDHTYTAPTFGMIAERYIASRTRASARSRDQYRQTVSTKLKALVSRPIEAITDEEIRCVLNELSDAKKSATAAFEMCCSVFKYATNKAMLPQGNPCAYVEPPKRRGRVGMFLTSAEARLLVEACAADRFRTVAEALPKLIEVILGTGLRISEALGLIVADVNVDDPNAAWIDVERQLSRPTKNYPKLERVPVKTEAGQRRVVLDPETAAILAALIDGKPGDAPVFEDPETGGWWRQSRVSNAWTRARTRAQKAGLVKSPRIHDLRHTHAAWLLTDRVPLLAVSRRLGHESIKVTADTYGHLLPESDDAIRSALTARRTAMGGKPGGPAHTAGLAALPDAA